VSELSVGGFAIIFANDDLLDRGSSNSYDFPSIAGIEHHSVER
jgi:hypothetical protein